MSKHSPETPRSRNARNTGTRCRHAKLGEEPKRVASYGCMTLYQCAEALGVSHGTVANIEKSALGKLRAALLTEEERVELVRALGSLARRGRKAMR